MGLGKSELSQAFQALVNYDIIVLVVFSLLRIRRHVGSLSKNNGNAGRLRERYLKLLFSIATLSRLLPSLLAWKVCFNISEVKLVSTVRRFGADKIENLWRGARILRITSISHRCQSENG